MTAPSALDHAPRPDAAALRALLDEAAREPRARVSLVLASPDASGFDELRRVPLELRAAAQRAEEDLARAGVEAAERGRMLAPLRALHEGLREGSPAPAALPPLPWTLALCLDARGARRWTFGTRLEAFERPLVAVSRRPRVLPLLEALSHERRYRALALSPRRVALFEGDASGARARAAPDVPGTLEAALGAQLEAPEGHQQHSAGRDASGDARAAVVHHGQGGASAERSLDLERFHRAVAAAVAEHWRGAGTPLVLFADAGSQGRFRKAHALEGLLAQGVEGNADELSPAQVHEAAWPLVHALAQEQARSAEDDLERARGQAEACVEGVPELVRRALESRVERLWIAADAARPGHVREDDGSLEEGWPGEDVLDELAGIVLRRGGAVHVLPRGSRPSRTGVAGLLHGHA